MGEGRKRVLLIAASVGSAALNLSLRLGGQRNPLGRGRGGMRWRNLISGSGGSTTS